MAKLAMDQENPQILPRDINQGFAKLLNAHGYSYQYAVITRLEELLRSKKSTWRFAGAEVPVRQGEKDGHVDFLCYAETGNPRHSLILVAECKNVDPAKGYWCFA